MTDLLFGYRFQMIRTTTLVLIPVGQVDADYDEFEEVLDVTDGCLVGAGFGSLDV